MKLKIDKLVKLLEKSKRPVLLVGSGINISGTKKELLKFSTINKIPVVSAWAIDAYPNFNRLYYGRQGSIGNRVGNYVTQKCDTLIVLGSRLAIRQTSYNWSEFAKKATKISVDIDPFEQNKNLIKYNLKLTCDLKDFFKYINKRKIKIYDSKKKLKWAKWLKWCDFVKKKLTPKKNDYKVYQSKINIYHFIFELFKNLRNKEIIVAADGAATVVPNQVGYLNDGITYIANSGSASMGYDLPAAIGAAIAEPKRKIICIAGDGSIMMNLQELKTIQNLNLNILIFVVNNDGYLSIKQTQNNFFKRETGASSKSGLTFPNFESIAKSFDIKAKTLNYNNWENEISKIIKHKKGPFLINLYVDTIQEFEPKLKSIKVKDRIITPSLEKMFPHLNKKIETKIQKKLNEIY